MYENITKAELRRLCEDWDNLSDEEIIDLGKAYQRLYPINEMSYNRGMFIGLCGDVSEQITYNLVYIIILGSFTPFKRYVNHWQTELMTYVKRVFNCNTEKSVKKDKIVYDFIVDTYIDQLTWEFDNIPIAERALKDEIRKGSKNKQYLYEVNYIKNKILPDIDNLVDDHKQEFAVLYKALVKAFTRKDLNIFKRELYKS